MQLLPHLDGELTNYEIRLDKPITFAERNTLVAYDVDVRSERLKYVNVNIDHCNQPLLWSLHTAMHNDVQKVFEEYINDFIKKEGINRHHDIHKIRPYVDGLLNDPSFKPLRDLEDLYNSILKILMKETAIRFVNELMPYNLPHIKPQPGSRYLFDETIYYHPPSRTLTVLKPDGKCIPTGNVSLNLYARRPD